MANIFLKMGANELNGQSEVWTRFFSGKLILGLSLYGFSTIVYIMILRWLPLNVAQSFAAAQFIVVILASWYFLNEPISFLRLVGIGFIALGITIVAVSR